MGSIGSGKRRGKPRIHVCLCSDDTDLRPAAVAIKSAFELAAEPERLVFHFITASDYAQIFQELLSTYLPGVTVEFHHDTRLQDKMDSVSAADKRDTLESSFHLAPLYLNEFLQERKGGKKLPQRIVYIDTDTVVMGDIGELHSMSMRGKPCAVACLRYWQDHIDLQTLRWLGLEAPHPEACVANHGVMVIDTGRWKTMNITGKLEDWMLRYSAVGRPIWKESLASQPPWLLALTGEFLELSEEWSCDSLGRGAMSAQESAALQKKGLDRGGLHQLHGRLGRQGQITPYVATCSKTGKLLHFNGAVKPWLLDPDGEEDGPHPPSCSVPTSLPTSAWSWSLLIRLFCEGSKFMSCADIWTAFITREAACALRDFDQEWHRDEEIWARSRRKVVEKSQEQRQLEDRRSSEPAQEQTGDDLASGW